MNACLNCLGVLFLFFVAFVVVGFSASLAREDRPRWGEKETYYEKNWATRPPWKTPHQRIRPGSLGSYVRVKRKADSTRPVPIAVTRDANDKLARVLRARDDVARRQLYADGLVFDVPGGTECRVVRTARTCVKVRVTEGRHYGKAGWVFRSWAR